MIVHVLFIINNINIKKSYSEYQRLTCTHNFKRAHCAVAIIHAKCC